MKRLAVFLGLLLLLCSCVKEHAVGIENFNITIQINRNGTFAYKFDGVLVLDAGWFRPSSEEFIKKEEEKARKDTAYKEFKYIGNNRFRVVFEETGRLEKTFISDLVSLEQSAPGKLSLKSNINTGKQYKDWCQKNAVHFGGTLTVKTDAEVISHNAQTSPWFGFWRVNTYGWNITSLDDPAPSMELQLQVGAAQLKAELVNRFEKGREGFLTRLFHPVTGQVQLTFPDGRTQILPYRSHLQPVVTHDGKTCIFTTEDKKLTGIVVYDSARGWGQSFLLPDDLWSHPGTSQPSFSPDGTKVAYYFGGKGEGKPEIRAGLMDLTGKEVVLLPQCEYCRNPAEGLVSVKLKGKWGYLDITGKMVIPPRFAEAGDFSEGLAPVKQEGKWGFIDRTGKMAIKPQFSVVYNFSGGLALVKVKRQDLERGFIDRSGKMVIPPQAGFTDSGFHEGLAIVYIDKKAGFIDQAEKLAIPPQFKGARGFHEGLACVYIDDKAGFIDKTGKMVIPPQFGPDTQDFADGVAWIWILGPKAGWGIIDRAGNLTVPQEELGSLPKEQPKPFSGGLALVASAIGKWGFMDKTGTFVIPPQYHQAEKFSEGLAAVNVGGKWGYGKWDHGKWGFIDLAGNMVIPAHYDYACSFSAGRALVAMDGKYRSIDRTGKMVTLPQHDRFEPIPGGMLIWTDFRNLKRYSGQKIELPRVRVRSWPDWKILWQSPPFIPKLLGGDHQPPLWESNSLVEFNPEFFDPPRFLKFQVPEPGGKDAQ